MYYEHKVLFLEYLVLCLQIQCTCNISMYYYALLYIDKLFVYIMCAGLSYSAVLCMMQVQEQHVASSLHQEKAPFTWRMSTALGTRQTSVSVPSKTDKSATICKMLASSVKVCYTLYIMSRRLGCWFMQYYCLQLVFVFINLLLSDVFWVAPATYVCVGKVQRYSWILLYSHLVHM